MVFVTACEETDNTNSGEEAIVSSILAVAEFEGDNEIIKVGGLPDSVPPGSQVVVTNLDTDETKETTGLPDGSFAPEFEASTDNIFRVEVFDNGELVDSTDLSVITLESLVNKDLALLGNFPSSLEIRDGRAYVTNSGSNNVQVFDIDQNPPVEVGMIVLPPASNPLNIAFISDQQALVTNNIGQTAAVVNLETLECEKLYTRQEGVDFEPCNEAINLGTGRFEEPSGVLVIGNTAYVSNNNLDANFNPNGNGFITVIDLNTDSSFTVQSNGANPSGMVIAGEEIFIVNAGDINFNPIDSSFTCNQSFPPSIDVLNINSNTIVENIPIPLSETNPNVCSPGAIATTPGNDFAYVGLGLAGALLKVDLVNSQLVNGLDDPIVITSLNGLNFTADIVIDEKGIGFTSLFNSDQIAVFDTSTDEINPFPVIAPFPAGIGASNSVTAFEGVQSLAINQNSTGENFAAPNIFFTTGISAQLGSINANTIQP